MLVSHHLQGLSLCFRNLSRTWLHRILCMEEFKAVGIPKSPIHMHGNHACMAIPHGYFPSHLHTRFSLYTTYPFFTHYPFLSLPALYSTLIPHPAWPSLSLAYPRFSLYTTYPFFTHYPFLSLSLRYPPSTQHSFPPCMVILISLTYPCFSLYTTYPFYTHYPPSTQHSFPSCMAILISHLSPFLSLHHVFVFQMLIKFMPHAFVWPCMATLTLTNVSTISFHLSNSIVPVTMLTSPYPPYPFHTHAHPNHAFLTIPVSSIPSFPLHHHTRHPLSISYP